MRFWREPVYRKKTRLGRGCFPGFIKGIPFSHGIFALSYPGGNGGRIPIVIYDPLDPIPFYIDWNRHPEHQGRELPT